MVRLGGRGAGVLVGGAVLAAITGGGVAWADPPIPTYTCEQVQPIPAAGGAAGQACKSSNGAPTSGQINSAFRMQSNQKTIECSPPAKGAPAGTVSGPAPGQLYVTGVHC